MHFIAEVNQLQQETAQAMCFAFCDSLILTKTVAENVTFPCIADLQLAGIQPVRKQHLGQLDGEPCYSVELPKGVAAPAGMVFYDLRQLFGLVEDDLFALAGRAIQVVQWDRNHLYCGHCGTPMAAKTNEYAKVCPQCGLVNYPRIAPAVIVAIVKGNQILLARNKQRRFNFYSVLAGFVEPGESLEDCVQREILEEVGIKVQDITYFGSQPWPFPHSLMVAFTATYAGGEIKVDDYEIADAGWFTVAEIPPIPGRLSIARDLIDWFIANQQ